jgi:hypothetical protein
MSNPPIYGTLGNDSLSGDGGNDNIYGGAGNDFVDGGAGDDNLRGGDGNDQLYGGDGNDLLNGDLGADIMMGGLGNDTYVVDSIFDQVLEGAGEGYDTVKSYVSYTLGDSIERIDLQGGTAKIDATGNALDNTLKGNFGDNVLMGMDGNDSISGSDGQDTLIGGAGHDWLAGGNDADLFELGAWSSYTLVSGKAVSTSSDTITDFQSGVDQLVINDIDYAAVGTGALNPLYFVNGAAATIAHAQFVYDQAHKALYFDSDGTGAAKMVKIADVSNAAPISASDFFVQAIAPTQPRLLTFTDLNPPWDSAPIPADYHGFSFTTGNNLPSNTTSYSYNSPMSALDGSVNNFYTDPTSGYHTAGGAVAFNTSGLQGTDLHRTDGHDFVFQGMDVTSAWTAGQEVTFHGFNNGYEVYTETIHASRDAVAHFAANWLIDDLQIEVHTTGGGILQQTVFDNIATLIDIHP